MSRPRHEWVDLSDVTYSEQCRVKTAQCVCSVLRHVSVTPTMHFATYVDPTAGDGGSEWFERDAGFAGDEPGNTHPTLKSTPLMRHLVKLIAKPGDVVLDAFCGSGSTGRGALLEGCRFIGIEREDTEAEPYVTIARRRIADAESKHNESLLIQGKRKGKAQQDLL